MITIMQPEEKHNEQIKWVEHAARFFAECIGATKKQQYIAGAQAILHFNEGNSGARSVFYGFCIARSLIEWQLKLDGQNPLAGEHQANDMRGMQ